MFALESESPNVWEFFKQGNFSVNKTSIPFSAIGADHAIEHENRAMKVLGGITGIANNDSALKRHFLIAADMNIILDNFCSEFNISNKGSKRLEHYQLSGSTNHRITSNTIKMKQVMEEQSINFDDYDCVFNVITKTVLPPPAATEFLNHEVEGEIHYTEFINARIVGNTSIWDSRKKRNLSTFKTMVKATKVPLKEKIVQLKEERSLMTRFIIASRKRSEIDLPFYLGTFEFSVVPRSIFNSQGNILLANDKSSFLHQIENMINSNEIQLVQEPPLETNFKKAIIIDAMAEVQKIKKSPQLITCHDFAVAFVQRILFLSDGFNEIRVTFDRYIENSLKNKTRDKRTNGVSTQFKILPSTNIEKVNLKIFLSDIKTKRDLTIFLGQYVIKALEEKQIRYAVVFDTDCYTNIEKFDRNLLTHTHEEADTLIILHAVDISSHDPFTELYILSPDTDVFLLLVHFYPSLCPMTVFRTGTGNQRRDISIRDAYEALGAKKSAAVLGLHSFSGCDQTAKFFGKSKATCWKTFMAANDPVITAFQLLGTSTDEEQNEIISGIEEYILDLYLPKRPSNINDVASLRWYLFSKFQYQSEKLPPTLSTLLLKIKRSNYISYIWHTANHPSPDIPSPENHGWLLEENIYKVQMTNQPPAPEAIIEISICRCKLNCDTKRCTCKKMNLSVRKCVYVRTARMWIKMTIYLKLEVMTIWRSGSDLIRHHLIKTLCSVVDIYIQLFYSYNLC